MAERTLAAALAAGVAGDLLLRVVPWGVNAFLWTAVLVAVLLLAARASGASLRGEGLWLAPVALALVSALALRDSATLRACTGLGLAFTLALLSTAGLAGSLRRRELTAWLAAPLVAAGHAAFGAVVLLAVDLRPGHGAARPRWRTAFAVGRGALLATPPLLVFGKLLAAADAAFERLLETLLGDLEAAFLHLVVAALVAWLAAGFVRLALRADATPGGPAAAPLRGGVGAVETGVVLGSLNALFLAFVVVQARTLFGGEAHVQQTLGLTFAEYARRGFFELVAVAALALPLLLALDALRAPGKRGARVFRRLAALTLALLAPVVVSALHRLHLYVGEYGLTELRLYAAVFTLWLVAVLGWFAATVLCGARDRFAFGAYAGAVAALLALVALNPAAWVVRVNAARAAATGRFDPWYATALGADAVPALVAALPELPPVGRCVAAARLLERWEPARRSDWRGWNAARAAARRTVRRERALLIGLACPRGTPAPIGRPAGRLPLAS